jgi:hypothetical protein
MEAEKQKKFITIIAGVAVGLSIVMIALSILNKNFNLIFIMITMWIPILIMWAASKRNKT